MKNKPKPEPTQAFLREIFDYTDEPFTDDKRTYIGGLLWRDVSRAAIIKVRQRKFGLAFAGGAFKHPKTGLLYPCICIDGVHYLSHRLIWVWHKGRIPNGKIIDHADRDTLHCRIENLRCVEESVNKSNKSKNRVSSSQYVGVLRNTSQWGKPWIAIFKCKKVTYRLGRFDNERDAAIARDRVAYQHLGEYGNYNFPELIHQKREIARLRQSGMKVFVVDNVEAGHAVFDD